MDPLDELLQTVGIVPDHSPAAEFLLPTVIQFPDDWVWEPYRGDLSASERHREFHAQMNAAIAFSKAHSAVWKFIS